MKTKYEIALKRSFNQVKRWRKAFYLDEDVEYAKDRFIKLIREELTESFEATNRSKSLDLYVDIVFFCLSSAIEEGLKFSEIYVEYSRADDAIDRSKCSWKSLGKELETTAYLLTAKGNWSLGSIIEQMLIVTKIIYGDRITDTEFFKAFDLVYKNNMKKYWTNEQVAKEFNSWIDKDALSVSSNVNMLYAKRYSAKKWVIKDSRGKVMKPPGFVGVKL